MKYQQVQQLLQQLERELKTVGLWQETPPDPQQLRSTQPFSVDTLAFHQWLQFIMIPRIQALIVQQRALPTAMGVSPMAVQVYKGKLREHRRVIACLRELDTVISGGDPMQAG